MDVSVSRQTPRVPHRAPPSDADLTLTTLGGLAVAHHDARLPTAPRPLGPGKPTALLAYLACAPARTAARETLAALLWGDREGEPARHALRQTLLHIRRQLGADPFTTGDDTITLAPHVRVDRDAFLAALDRDDPEAAVAAYAGEFCPHVALPGGLQFEHWADGERQRLRALFTAAAERVARRHLDLGRVREAVALARRVRAADPHAQSGWRLHLETLIAARDPLLGAEVAALERAAADDDVAIEPATRALLATARRGSTETRAGATTDGAPDGRELVAELVGREREFGVLVGAWDDVGRRRAGRHLHVAAPAGMGKTRLLADFHARLRGARARAVPARAVLAERDTPFAFVGAVVRALMPLRGAAGVSPAAGAALVALAPAASTYLSVPPSSATGDEAERQRSDAIGELLAALAHEAPLALLLDDWHWADAVSVRVLARVLARIDGLAVLVVTAGRGAMPSGGFGEALALAPLDVDALAALLASLGALPATPWAAALPAALQAASGGSPLLALQTLRSAIDGERMALVHGSWTCRDPEALHTLLAAGGAIDARLASLSAADRALLLLLAVAAAPLPMRVLQAAAVEHATTVEESLTTLERRGLAVREPCANADASDRCVAVAHDEIGAAARDGADAAAMRAAHARLAVAWHEHARVEGVATDGIADVAALRRAMQHALHASDGAATLPAGEPLARATAGTLDAYLRTRRAQGDRGSLREVARELAGHGADAATVTRLVRALPWRVRAAAHARRAVSVALFGVTVAALAVVGTLALRPSAAPAGPDAELLVVRGTTAGRAQAWRVSLRQSEWPDAPIALDMAAERAARDAYPRLFDRADALVGRQILLDDGGIVGTRDYADAGGPEVVRLGRDGAWTRLTASRHDDGPGDVSPDGRSLVITTGRWDANRANDLALLTLATGEVHQLTTTSDLDAEPRFGPDGTRIGFRRRAFTGIARPSVCTVPPDGSETRCVTPEALDVTEFLAWEDRRRVLVVGYERPSVADPTAVRALVLARVTLEDGAAEVIDRGGYRYTASPDGRWATCHCALDGYPGASEYVFPVARPREKRALVRDSLRVTLAERPHWRLPGRDARAMRAVEVRHPSSLPVGIPMRLHALAYDERGQPAPVDRVTWRSLDPAVAAVDSLGEAIGRAPGTARLVASAGGWRADTAVVRVTASAQRPLLDDAFPTAPGTRWRTLGAPPPYVAVARERRAFVLGGDGDYVNGAYSARAHDARDGLVLDAEVAIPVHDVHWQQLGVILATLDTMQLARWDHRTGPPPDAPQQISCGWSFPAYEGAGRAATAAIAADAFVQPVVAPPSLATGQWHRVRVELRPDGRCAAALDDAPPVLLESALPLDRPFHVMVIGQSAGTQVSVGRVRLWSGVRAPDAEPVPLRAPSPPPPPPRGPASRSRR